MYTLKHQAKLKKEAGLPLKMGTNGTSEESSHVQFSDLGGYMDMLTGTKLIELYSDDSAFSYRYVIYTSVKRWKIKLANQQNLGASNFYFTTKHCCTCNGTFLLEWFSMMPFCVSTAHQAPSLTHMPRYSLAYQPVFPHGTNCCLKSFTCPWNVGQCKQGSCLLFTAISFAPRSVPGS